VKLGEPQDIYVLSVDFWNIFKDRYGCDMAIQMRKYAEIEDMVPKDLVINKNYATYEMTPDDQFNEYTNICNLPFGRERIEAEQEVTRRLQNDKTKHKFYLIDGEWINNWLNYTRKFPEFNHPGPIDNNNVKQVMLKDELMSSSRGPGEQPNFYSVSKDLFVFFYCVYGGGPAIVDYSQYQKYELQKDVRDPRFHEEKSMTDIEAQPTPIPSGRRGPFGNNNGNMYNTSAGIGRKNYIP